MSRPAAACVLLFVLLGLGCGTWQGGRSSQGIEVDPYSEPHLRPANTGGYMDGIPQNQRTSR